MRYDSRGVELPVLNESENVQLSLVLLIVLGRRTFSLATVVASVARMSRLFTVS